jgi:phage host-nuclease inhibitor protein Gam
MKKNKIPVCLVLSRESLDAAVADVATLKLRYAAAKAEMELAVAAAQEQHQAALLDLSRQIEAREAAVFIYCQQHRAELFPEKKSVDFLLATVGFRTEPPSVEKNYKKDTWTAVARRLEALEWGAAYVTTPEPEPDKKALLRDRQALTAGQLGQAGIRFEQDEVFYITPRSEVSGTTTLRAA